MFKKRIGITQKVVKHSNYDEIMDCLDTNWAKLLVPLGILPIPIPLISTNLINDFWQNLKLDGLILSGGNTIADYSDNNDKLDSISIERDIYEQALIKVAIKTNTPILGVCRGLQVINVFYKGGLKKTKGHAGTRHDLISENLNSRYKIPSEVNSFHDCVVSRELLGKDLLPLAHDKEDNIEALYNERDKVLGIMWHPEREKIPLKSDCELIKNHFDI